MRSMVNLPSVEQALTDRFDFYHLGEIRSADARVAGGDHSEPLLEDCAILGFRILGDVRGLFAMVYERGLDPSIYSEVGNVLASRFATRLSAEDGLEVMISPPGAITPEQLIGFGPKPVSQLFFHEIEGRIIPLRTFVYLSSPEDGIHA